MEVELQDLKRVELLEFKGFELPIGWMKGGSLVNQMYETKIVTLPVKY